MNEEEKDKKEGLFKRLKYIEGKNEELLKVKNKTENIKKSLILLTTFKFTAKELIEEIKALVI